MRSLRVRYARSLDQKAIESRYSNPQWPATAYSAVMQFQFSDPKEGDRGIISHHLVVK